MFNSDEEKMLKAFNDLDLTNQKYCMPFIDFVDNALNRDPSNRAALFSITANVKRLLTQRISRTASTEKAETYSNLYWQLVLMEGRQHFLDSYLLYLEKNRLPKDKFYAPKRKCFLKIGLIQALQDLIDDKLDVLSISMPPGTGKALTMKAKILTPKGWVRMKKIQVGDTVMSGALRPTKVVGVYPQGEMAVYDVILENGKTCRCTADHLWTVKQYAVINGEFVLSRLRDCVETRDLMWGTTKYAIPVTNGYLKKVEWIPVMDVVYAGKDECQCIAVDDVSRTYITDDYVITHNTTVLKFFHSAVAGWYPEGFSLFWTHSDDIARMYYDGVYDIVSNEIEYTWHEIFPDLSITRTNAKMEQFNIGPYKPFPSIQCTSTGAKNAGKVRANMFLIVDDMIGSIEEALSKTMLDKLWTAYTVNAMQRKVPRSDEKPCKEIHCATRWSVNDVIGRLQRAYEGNPRARFIAIPDIDARTGESNFQYEIGGFTKRFFDSQALLMDDISYRCLYRQDPIEREGLLYTEDDVRFFQSLPQAEPDAILAVCDTKSTGIDYMVMPVFYQYGADYYVVDVICDDSSNFNRQYKRLAEMLMNYNVQQCEFEANAGGSRVAFEVNKRIEEAGRFCNITSKTTLTNKETRIIVNSDFIKQHVLFRDKEQYTRKSEYGVFMHFLFGYSVAGKNVHDDVPDCLSNFSLYVQKMNRLRPASIIPSPI